MRVLKALLVLAVVLSAVLAGRPAQASTADLVAHLDELASSFVGGVGLWIADPNAATPLYTRNPDEHVIAASLYKLGILAEAQRPGDAGELKDSGTIAV